MKYFVLVNWIKVTIFTWDQFKYLIKKDKQYKKVHKDG